jgi:Flp pilus assembly protein TadD/TolB-like protein
MSLSPGTRLGNYEILAPLGRGSMGMVYKAIDVKLQRPVALKFLLADLGDPSDKNRFLREARAASALDHANIGTIHGIEETGDGQLFIVMAFYEGETLAQRLKRGPLSLDSAVSFARQTALALAEAHSKGVVHRDVKPSNIMITRQGGLKLLDFGLANMADSESLTQSGATMGTPAYMSPEQALGISVDRRSDIWSLGVVLYEMLAGRRPFQRENVPSTLLAASMDPPPPLVGIEPALEAVVYRCLAKDREQRYQQAADILIDLNRMRESGEEATMAIDATATESSKRARALASADLPGLQTAPPVRRFPRMWVALAGLIVAVAGLASWYWRGPAVPLERHVVVLPFQNIGGDPANAAICDGLLETLTSRLSGLEGVAASLWVAPASEVRAKKVVDAASATKAFGANLVVAGGVQRDANGVRLTLNLVDAHTLKQLGAAVIEDRQGDFSTLEAGAVNRLAAMLKVELKPGKFAASGESTAPVAYESYLKGLSYLQRYDQPGNLDTAILNLRNAVKSDPRFALGYAKLATAEALQAKLSNDQGMMDRALADAKSATELNDDLAPVHVAMGGIHARLARYDLAVQEFQRALQLDPRNAEAHQRLAGAYESMGRMADAEASLKKAIALRPDYWDGYNSLGSFYINRRQYEDAVSQFRKVLELTPDNASAWSNMGVALKNLDDNAGARVAYEKSIAIAPSSAGYTNLAVILYNGRDYLKAAETYEKALKMNDRDWRTWQGLASAWRGAGQKEKARSATEQAVKLAEDLIVRSPNDAETRSYLAFDYALLGVRDKALKHVQSALALAADNPRVLFRAGIVYELLGDRAAALKWLKEARVHGYPIKSILSDSNLSKLREDPAFQSLIR